MGNVMWGVGQDKSVGVWDLSGPGHSPRLLRRLPGHTSFVNSLCRVKCVEVRTIWSSSAGDGTLRVWRQEVSGAPSYGTGDDHTAHFASDDASQDLAEARAAAATTAAAYAQLEAKLRRMDEKNGKLARASEAREASLHAELENSRAKLESLRTGALQDQRAALEEAGRQREAEDALRARAQAQDSQLRALRDALAAARLALEAMGEDWRGAARRAVGEAEGRAAAEAEARAAAAEAARWREEAERLRSEGAAKGGQVEALRLESQRLVEDNARLLARVAELEAAALATQGAFEVTRAADASRLAELEALLAAEKEARAAAELEAERASQSEAAALKAAQIAKNQLTVAESKVRAMAKARTEEEAKARAEAERLELLELRLRREAREAAASGGESSEAALRLAARVAELEAEVADLEATRQEERRAAQAEHAKLMDAKREIGDLKRLLKDRDALLGDSSNARARAEQQETQRSRVLAEMASAREDLRRAVESEARAKLRLLDLDIFRLDVIARELKRVDENLGVLAERAGERGGASSEAGADAAATQGARHGRPLSTESVAWCRGHIKDVITQCLKETHKLHIGAPLDDPGANGEKIREAGTKGYLIVEADLYPDAITLTD
mmetsp:Transcript_40039/g.89779  ORF Transcript_40039/g.89779 Transcript_40039/m.89779 type:complete len:621 (-) Transcript_40039:160-2022(-)